MILNGFVSYVYIADQLLVKKFILYGKLNQKPQEN